MELTPAQHELLFAAWGLARENRGMVITDKSYPDAHEVAEHTASLSGVSSRTANSPGGGRRRQRQH
jgi:hypothetical protein